MCKSVCPGSKPRVEVGHRCSELGQRGKQLGEGGVEGAARFREAKVGVEEFDFLWLNSGGLESGHELGGWKVEERVEWAYLAEVQDLGGPADLSHNRKCGCLNKRAQCCMGAEVAWVVRKAASRFFVSGLNTFASPISGLKHERPRVCRIKAAGKATVVEEGGSSLQGLRQKLGLGKGSVQDGCCRALKLVGFHEVEACPGKGLLKEEGCVLRSGV